MGVLAWRWLFADAMVSMADFYGELEQLEGPAYQARMQEWSLMVNESRNPVLSTLYVLRSADASFRYNIVVAGQLQRALRSVLDLPAVALLDPLDAELVETDDGEMMHFHVEDDGGGIDLHLKH